MNGYVKICGITDRAGMEAALNHGADVVGLVFREDSPRFVSLEHAAMLTTLARGRARLGAIISDAGDDFLSALVEKVKPDLLQLHGRESPQRVAAIVARFTLPVVKTLGIAQKEDLDALTPYEPVCERILLEARMPDGRPCGGSGRSFDWKLLQQVKRREHIMLAGGLTPANVGEAIETAKVGAVDVCSGVERALGIKDEVKVAHFISAARAAFARSAPGI